MEKKLFKYIEIKSLDKGEVVKRMDCTGKSDNDMIRAEAGININLNKDKFYTFSFESETPLPKI